MAFPPRRFTQAALFLLCLPLVLPSFCLRFLSCTPTVQLSRESTRLQDARLIEILGAPPGDDQITPLYIQYHANYAAYTCCASPMRSPLFFFFVFFYVVGRLVNVAVDAAVCPVHWHGVRWNGVPAARLPIVNARAPAAAMVRISSPTKSTAPPRRGLSRSSSFCGTSRPRIVSCPLPPPPYRDRVVGSMGG